ncbi:MAG: response regulator [Campylobacterota bacterium]|nr:response regulator [Campylobacterota bacterium]
MKNKINYYSINELTNSLNVLVIQSSCEIENNFSKYFTEIFSSVTYMTKYDNLIEFVKDKKPDFIFLDIQTQNLQPFKFINIVQDIIPNQIFIIISSISNKEILLKSINCHITSFLEKPFTTTDLKDTVVNCLNFIVRNNPNLLSDKKESNGDTTVIDAISYLMENYQNNIELINHYKGVPLIRNASIVDLKGDTVSIKIKDIQKYILDYSNHTIINTNYFTGDIYAYLKEVDINKGIAIFHKLNFIPSYVHHRKNPRISPDDNFKITMKGKKILYSFNIIDVSINYALVTLASLPENLIINTEHDIYLSFQEPKNFRESKFEAYRIHTKCTISDIFDIKSSKKILLNFNLKENDREKLDSYIYKRGLELVAEFKANYLKSLKK